MMEGDVMKKRITSGNLPGYKEESTSGNREVSHLDILLALERLNGEVSALRALMESHILATTTIQRDHESRLRQVEKAVQSGRGIAVFLGAAIALLGALGAWINISPK